MVAVLHYNYMNMLYGGVVMSLAKTSELSHIFSRVARNTFNCPFFVILVLT